MVGVPALDLIRKGQEPSKANHRGKELTEDEWIQAMVEHPILIERPIVVKQGKAAIGRPPENIRQIL